MSRSAAPLRIGIAGLGTVGSGTLALLSAQGDLLARRCGRPLVVTAVSARDRKRDRGVSLAGIRWVEDAADLATDGQVDVVVELIGGEDGIARRLIESAFAHRKHVVTANKALLAKAGAALARQAEAAGLTLAYEAAVAGGVPVIKALREGLAANRLSRIYGILNGTCNYILSTMRETGAEFADVLAEAQRLGYAEADPAFDIDGVDAAHKLCVLASVAFGCAVDFDMIHVEGIRHISALDIEYAAELGYRVKLLGVAELGEAGLSLRVHPCLVPLSTPIAHVEGVFNAVIAEGDFVGRVEFEGRGAGAGPTASAVVADLMDIARGIRVPTFSVPATELVQLPALPLAHHRGAFYVRLMVLDQPGVFADVAAALRDAKVSMESVIQRGRAPDGPVPVVMTIHETEEGAMALALARIASLPAVTTPPRMIRIAHF